MASVFSFLCYYFSSTFKSTLICCRFCLDSLSADFVWLQLQILKKLHRLHCQWTERQWIQDSELKSARHTCSHDYHCSQALSFKPGTRKRVLFFSVSLLPLKNDCEAEPFVHQMGHLLSLLQKNVSPTSPVTISCYLTKVYVSLRKKLFYCRLRRWQ